MKVFKLAIIIGFFGLVSLILQPGNAYALNDPTDLVKAVQEIEYLDSMRSSLAESLKEQTEPPTPKPLNKFVNP